MKESTPSASGRWLLAFFLSLPLLAVVLYFASPSDELPPAASPGRLTGTFSLYIMRTGAGSEKALPIEEPETLPVHNGEGLALEVRFNQPAYAYMVWFNSRGEVIPLYPWNKDEIKVRNVSATPPPCSAAAFLMSPTSLGKSWKFTREPGVETVLLLARLDPEITAFPLGDLIGQPESPKTFAPLLHVLDGVPAVRTMFTLPPDAKTEEDSFNPLLRKLAQHFDLVRAVRFQHVD